MEQAQSQNIQELQEGRWTQEQHLRFLKGIFLVKKGIMEHGKDWKIIENIVKTRLGSQVRSHAQKFFIKLNKISRERKKGKTLESYLPTEIQKQILKFFRESDITKNTPSEIVYVLRHDWSVPQHLPQPKKRTSKPKHVTQLKKLNVYDQQPLQPENNLIQDLPRDQESGQNHDNEESFFMQLIKMKKQHFINGNQFKNLFNFGIKDIGAPDQQQTGLHNLQVGFTPHNPNHETFPPRKRSFGLLNEEEDDEKLKGTLKNLHKAMGFSE